MHAKRPRDSELFLGLTRTFSIAIVALAINACGGGDKEPMASVPEGQVQAIKVPTAGDERDLIVVFDDTAVESEASTLVRRRALRAADSDVLDLKARRLTALKQQALQLLDSNDFVVKTTYGQLPISHVVVRDAATAARLRKLPGVVGVFKNETRQKLFLEQSLPLVRQPQALAAGADGRGTSVVVLDTLVDYSNAAFGGCTSPGQPSTCKVLIAQDVDGKPPDGLGFQEHHGTNVAATVVAVAPATKIIAFNVFNGAGTKDTDVIKGIDWAIANQNAYNIVAVNMSLGGGRAYAPVTSGTYFTAIARLRSAGIVPVAAAGNDGYRDSLLIPAAVQGAVSVGAVYDDDYGGRTYSTSGCTDYTTSIDQVTCFSDSSNFLTILAPGAKSNAAGYIKQGTSQAAPFVAGTVAVLKSVYPQDTVEQTVFRLTQGPQITDPKSGIAKPRLQLDKSLSLSPCLYTVSKTSLSFSASGGINSDVQITTPAGCTWQPQSSENWLTVDSTTIINGSGVIQYTVQPNNSAFARSGSISVAGLTISVSQSAGAKSLSSTSNIWLIGSYGYSAPGDGTVTLKADYVYNASSTRTSGSLRLELWLSTTPYVDISSFRGWQIATARILSSSDGTLLPGFEYPNLNLTTTLKNRPKPDRYYVTLLVSEYSSTCSGDGYCPVAAGGFNNFYTIQDVSPPTIPADFVVSPIDSSSVGLRWAASSDNVGVVKYDIYNNGVLLGSVASDRISATVVNLSAQTNYTFGISACDAAENCSTPTSTANISTPPAGSTINVIQNSNFESGSTGWTTASRTTIPLIGSYSGSHSGVKDLYLCGYTNCSDAASQTLTIPSDATSAFLDVWVKIYSSPTSLYDTLVAEAYDSVTSLRLSVIKSWSNLNLTGGWYEYLIDVSNYIGRTISLKFTGTTSLTTNSSYYLDDVYLFTNGSPPLTVSKSGVGSGQITSDNGGISCGAICSATVKAGTNVTLSATPEIGSLFTGWSGACSGLGSCTVAGGAVKSVTATFANAATTLQMPWFTKVNGYISRFVILNSGTSNATYNISIYTESGNAVILKPGKTSGILPAGSQFVLQVDDVVSSFAGGQRGMAVITTNASASDVVGIYNLVQPTTGSISNVSLLATGDLSASSSKLVAPWVTLNPLYRGDLILTNLGSSAATASLSYLPSQGSTVLPLLTTLNIPAKSQVIVSGSTLATVNGGNSFAAVVQVNAPSGLVKGTYKVFNIASGAASSAELVTPAADSPTTSLVMPWFSIAAGYESKFVLTNRGSSPANYTASIIPEVGNTITTGSLTGSIPAGGQIIIPASSLLTSTSGATRAGAVFNIAGSASEIDGVYQILSSSTGAISNTVMARGSLSTQQTTRLRLPWFSAASGYVSRFVMLNRSSSAAAFSLQILPEAGNAVTQQLIATGSIPANSQLVLPVSSVIQGFTGASRAAAVFNVSGPDASIDGLYNIVNPVSGAISNTLMSR